jgi:hypothetical protein
MSATVLVICRDCRGATTLADGTACGFCMAQGHVAVDRTPDGAVPHDEVEWIAPTLAATPATVWTLSHPRCAP